MCLFLYFESRFEACETGFEFHILGFNIGKTLCLGIIIILKRFDCFDEDRNDVGVCDGFVALTVRADQLRQNLLHLLRDKADLLSTEEVHALSRLPIE